MYLIKLVSILPTNKCSCSKTGAPGLYQKLSVGVFCLKNLSHVQNRTIRSPGSPPPLKLVADEMALYVQI